MAPQVSPIAWNATIICHTHDYTPVCPTPCHPANHPAVTCVCSFGHHHHHRSFVRLSGAGCLGSPVRNHALLTSCLGHSLFRAWRPKSPQSIQVKQLFASLNDRTPVEPTTQTIYGPTRGAHVIGAGPDRIIREPISGNSAAIGWSGTIKADLLCPMLSLHWFI